MRGGDALPLVVPGCVRGEAQGLMDAELLAVNAAFFW